MEHSRWEKIKDILNEISQLPKAERKEYLKAACRDDESLMAELFPYVEVDLQKVAFLETPILLHAKPAFPKLVGPYRIREEMGRGGMGIVYAGEREDGLYHRNVAIKVLKRGMDSEEILQRFNRERQILANLHHPHIATLFDGGMTDCGRPFFVMELVEGDLIHDYCRKQSPSLDERLILFKKICDAVHDAHKNLVIHRDIKPSNILVSPSGEPKLLDFGIAKLLDPQFDAQQGNLPTKTPIMTPEYASPEQIQSGVITTASDTYSLGVLLCMLLTGKRPYPLQVSIQEAICKSPPVKPSDLLEKSDNQNPGIGLPYNHRGKLKGDLDRITLKALKKDPRERFGSVEQFSQDITRYLNHLPIQAPESRPFYHLGKWMIRHRWLATTLIILALSISVFTVMFMRKQFEYMREYEQTRKLSQFLGNMFQLIDPYKGKNSSLTLEEFLDRALLELDSQKSQNPDYLVNLLQIIGNSYLKLGLLSKAEPVLMQAVDLSRVNSGIDPKDRANSLYLLGYLYHRLDRIPEGKPLLLEAAKLQRKELGQKHPEYAQTLATLGSVLAKTQRYQEAETHLQKALAIFGEDHSNYPMTLNSLGSCYQKAGLYSQAEKVFLRVIDINDSHYPDAEARPALNNLGLVYSRLGKFDLAEHYLKRAWQHDGRFLGPEHPFVLIIMGNLANTKLNQGHYAEAEELLRKVLKTRKEKKLPFKFILNDLGRACFLQGRLDEAEELYKQVRANLSNKRTGLNIALRANLADVFHKRQDYAEAEAYYLENHEAVLTKHGPQHPFTARTLFGLAENYRAQGLVEKAWSLHMQGLEIRKAKLPAKNPKIGSSYFCLAKLAQSRKDPLQAIAYCRQALAIQRDSLGEDHFKTQSSKAFLQELLTTPNTRMDGESTEPDPKP